MPIPLLNSFLDEGPVDTPLEDHVVAGRKLSEWRVEDTGDTLDDMFSWKHAFGRAFGDRHISIAEALGEQFDREFKARYTALVRKEQEREQAESLDAVFVEGAHFLGYKDVKVLQRFLIPHGSWLPDHQYAVIEADGRKIVIGRLKGHWQEFEREHVAQGMKRMSLQLVDINWAIDILDGRITL